MLIAHYHWQVGLVADGRLLAAAAAASSDTVRGLACSARVSFTPPPPPLAHLRASGGLKGPSGVLQPPRPPALVRVLVWAAGRARRGARTPLPLPPIPPSLAACPPTPHSFLLPHRNRKGLGHSPGGFPAADAGPGGGARSPLPPCGPRPSLGARSTAALRCAPPRLFF